MFNSPLQKTLLGTIGASVTDTLEADDHPLKLVRLDPLSDTALATIAAPEDAKTPAKVVFRDRDADVKDGAQLMNALAALLLNVEIVSDRPKAARGAGEKVKLLSGKDSTLSDFFGTIDQLLGEIDQKLGENLDKVVQGPAFRELERNWRGLDELCDEVEQEDIYIDFLDVTREELRADFADHDSDIFGSALFQKVYVEEYDRYGGEPFATMIGLYEFEKVTNAAEDVKWLRTMSKIAAAAHCPFVSSAGPGFFDKKNMQEVADIADLDAILSRSKYGKWDVFRDEDYAAYIGLTVPRYLVRVPWGSTGDAETGNAVEYEETVKPGARGDDNHFLWGNAAVLFAKNLIRSYALSEWAQHIRGPKGGGLVAGLTVFSYKRKDDQIVYGKQAKQLESNEESLPPVEIVIPDFREFQFSRNGLMALVHKKGESVATFFSAQSVKKGKTFLEDVNTKNAQLVTNLAYTYSITQIAHYVKAMVREYIGSTADADYIQKTLAEWLGGFVTTVVNPDDLTLRYYPFKATSVTVEPKPGPFGWYKTVISILPHLQFEGMDVELRLEASLGGK
ncbi:type VI secretion system contractile sheath large subunit [Sorangium sp. So ce327]|jgi:type VI secretion system protein ImpC|uniref:type VI secretion system contractile sheath large subunit n=1 Tax=unclassified Sorangium TaxID=2621164 RepID=UPI003F637315